MVSFSALPAIMHHSDRTHLSDRQLHRARRYRVGAPYPRPRGVSITNRSPAATVTESHPHIGVSTAGTAPGAAMNASAYSRNRNPDEDRPQWRVPCLAWLSPSRDLRRLQAGHRIGQLLFGGQPFEELLQGTVLVAGIGIAVPAGQPHHQPLDVLPAGLVASRPGWSAPAGTRRRTTAPHRYRSVPSWRPCPWRPCAARTSRSRPARFPRIYPHAERGDQRSGCAMVSMTAVTARITTGSCPGATSTP